MNEDVADNSAEAPASAYAPLLAASISCGFLGVLTFAAEYVPVLKKFLVWIPATGSLGGKTLLATLVLAAAFPIIGRLLATKRVCPSRLCVLCAIAISVGLLGTFPPVFEFFQTK